MKSETTNIVSNEDYRKVQSMILHMFNKTKLHPEVQFNISKNEYNILGISHLDIPTINKLKMKCYADLFREIITTEWNIDQITIPYTKEKVISVQELDKTDEYVYDISMGGLNHLFFANQILVHNTDSVYFSVQHMMEQNGLEYTYDKDQTIELYNEIGNQVGATFPEFMNKSFNTGIEKGKIVGADLEMVGSRGLFLKKKRYAILKYYDDGVRLDGKNEKGEIVHGKLKNMGLEIKRSDTSKFIQIFLEETLMALLTGASEDELRKKILDFKAVFNKMKSYEKGSPKTVKNYTNLYKIYQKTGKCHVGHVQAAIEWNTLRYINEDQSVPEATDGTKVMVCKLKKNPMGIKTIGYPIECMNYLPEWFLELPFDDVEMEKTVVNKKLSNIFGILNMDIAIDVDSRLYHSNNSFLFN